MWCGGFSTAWCYQWRRLHAGPACTLTRCGWDNRLDGQLRLVPRQTEAVESEPFGR